MSEQAGRYQRSFGGLLGALLVLVIVVVGYVVIHAIAMPERTTSEPAVDYARVVPEARRAAKFHLVAPARLPHGWRATSVRFDPEPRQEWHLGVLTSGQHYVGLEQSDRTTGSMVETYVDQSASRGAPVDVAGRPWSTYTDSGGDLALVQRKRGTTTLVVGHDVSKETLVAYAESLR